MCSTLDTDWTLQSMGSGHHQAGRQQTAATKAAGGGEGGAAVTISSSPCTAGHPIVVRGSV